jgi:hypothetical protein
VTDTTYSLRALADGVVDFGITYDASLELAASSVAKLVGAI